MFFEGWLGAPGVVVFFIFSKCDQLELISDEGQFEEELEEFHANTLDIYYVAQLL